MLLAVSTVISGGSCGGRQDADLLVITNGDDLDAGFFRQFPNAQNVLRT